MHATCPTPTRQESGHMIYVCIDRQVGISPFFFPFPYSRFLLEDVRNENKVEMSLSYGTPRKWPLPTMDVRQVFIGLQGCIWEGGGTMEYLLNYGLRYLAQVPTLAHAFIRAQCACSSHRPSQGTARLLTQDTKAIIGGIQDDEARPCPNIHTCVYKVE